MFNTVMSLFKSKKEVFEVPVVQEPPKDISEPVLSFIECVKENPRRFKLKQFFGLVIGDYRTTYCVTDKVADITYKVVWDGRGSGSFPITCSVYLTQDEKEVLWYLFQNYFYNQASIKGELIRKRKVRERDKLKSVYCKNME
jgi:hypothetical protein